MRLVFSKYIHTHTLILFFLEGPFSYNYLPFWSFALVSGIINSRYSQMFLSECEIALLFEMIHLFLQEWVCEARYLFLKEIQEWAVTSFQISMKVHSALEHFHVGSRRLTLLLFLVCLLSLSGKHLMFCWPTLCREGEARLSRKEF